MNLMGVYDFPPYRPSLAGRGESFEVAPAILHCIIIDFKRIFGTAATTEHSVMVPRFQQQEEWGWVLELNYSGKRGSIRVARANPEEGGRGNLGLSGRIDAKRTCRSTMAPLGIRG